jgi:hypothetical protein
MEVFMSKETTLKRHAAEPQTHTSGWSRGSVQAAPEKAEAELSNDIHGTMAPPKVNGRTGDLPIEPHLAPHEALRLADHNLDAARFEHRQAKLVLTDARQRVQSALAAYNTANPPISPEQNVRDWIASNQARKARLAQAGQVPYRPSVTETAKAMSGGGHGNDIRTRRGGGAAYRRGPGGVQAFTKTQAMTANAERIREARAKLPAER